MNAFSYGLVFNRKNGYVLSDQSIFIQKAHVKQCGVDRDDEAFLIDDGYSVLAVFYNVGQEILSLSDFLFCLFPLADIP